MLKLGRGLGRGANGHFVTLIDIYISRHLCKMEPRSVQSLCICGTAFLQTKLLSD